VSDYDVDLYAWSRQQGALLRRLAAGERVNDTDLDWTNIADEIEAVARSERAALASCIFRSSFITRMDKPQRIPAVSQTM